MKRLDKTNVLEAATEKHKRVIRDFKNRVRELLASEAMVNEDDMDLTQRSINVETNDEIMNLRAEIAFAQDELTFLNRLDVATERTEVAPGAIVETDKEIFFVSASIERFKIDGTELFGISTKSPIYRTMKGMEKGDQFSYHDTRYKILDIY